MHLDRYKGNKRPRNVNTNEHLLRIQQQLKVAFAAGVYSWGTGTRMVVVIGGCNPSWLEVGPLAAFSLWSPSPLGAISTSNSVSQWLYQQLKGLTRAPLETVNFFQKSLGKNSNLQHILIFNSSCPKAPDSGDQSKSRSTNSESSLGRLDCFNQNVSWKVCILSIWLQLCSFIWREHEPNYNN